MIYLLHTNKLTNNKILISKVATIFQKKCLQESKIRKQNRNKKKEKQTFLSWIIKTH